MIVIRQFRWAAVLGLLAALPSAPAARADIKLSAMFTPHMVLQRDAHDKVWGWADAGEKIKVGINGQVKTTEAGKDGKWSVTLDPMPAGGPHSLSISGKNTVVIDDVLVGEVWVCSGQSNMEWQVGQSNDSDLEALTAKYPKIRLITVPKMGTQEPQSDFKGQWELCTPQTAREFSAVGYFFGRQLHETLDVPIGLIDNSWGASACEAWIRRDVLEADSKYANLIATWKKTEAGVAEAEIVYKKQLEDWKAASAKAKAENKPAPRPPANPADALRNQFRPGNIFAGMLKPSIGYGIRGAIWYQGETNASNAKLYRDMFPLMIKNWRDEWGIGDFSFYWVQLADFQAEKAQPAESNWAELREAQTLTLKLPKTGQAVITDLGEAQDIHPRDKQNVAKRLARWALANDYGVNVPYRSPEYKSLTVKDGKAIVQFSHVGGGLKAFDVPEIKGFAIAGKDGKYVWAKAKLTGRDTVEVSAEGVSEPVAVRYGWADNPVTNLYSQAGLPVTPFRSDSDAK